MIDLELPTLPPLMAPLSVIAHSRRRKKIKSNAGCSITSFSDFKNNNNQK